MRDVTPFEDVTVDLLGRGLGVRFRASGGSMAPAIEDGDLLLVEPLEDPAITLAPGDVVLVRRPTGLVAHRLIRIDREADPVRFELRGDASSRSDEPIAAERILGQVTEVDRRHGPPTRRLRRALRRIRSIRR